MTPPTDPPRWHPWAVLALAALALAPRLIDLGAPVIDGMAVKQVCNANRARVIAGPPFDVSRRTFEFLDLDGRPKELVEEVPLYVGLVAAGYRWVGEAEWVGRLVSVIAAAVAVLALEDLVRRRMGWRAGLVAAYLMALAPLLLFYGRAFQPDAAMLAAMLLSACAFDRFLARPRAATWLLAWLFCLLATAFKYFGLMVLLPLAVEAVRAWGLRWRGVLAVGGIAVGTVAPLAAWFALVFVPARNPGADGVYFAFQEPAVLLDPKFHASLFDRFLYRDCGPVLMLLAAVGFVAAVARPTRLPSVLVGWGAAGYLFFLLLAPKVRYHDYYELMMLPAAAMWAAIGWEFGWRRGGTAARVVLVGLLAAAPLVHTRWVWRSHFDRELGLYLLADRMAELCGPNGRFVVRGPFAGHITAHYARRPAWVSDEANLGSVEHYRRLGADFMLVYLNHTVPEDERPRYRAEAARWPLVETGIQPWDYLGKDVEYYIVRLRPNP